MMGVVCPLHDVHSTHPESYKFLVIVNTVRKTSLQIYSQTPVYCCGLVTIAECIQFILSLQHYVYFQ